MELKQTLKQRQRCPECENKDIEITKLVIRLQRYKKHNKKITKYLEIIKFKLNELYENLTRRRKGIEGVKP